MKRTKGFVRRGRRITYDEQLAAFIERRIEFALPEKGRARRKRAIARHGGRRR